MSDKAFESILSSIKNIRELELESYNKGFKEGYDKAMEDMEMVKEIKNKQ